MNFLAMFFAVLSFFLGGVGYAASGDWLIGMAIGGSFLLLFEFVILKMAVAYETKIRKRHECYQFVNTYLITLSVSSSLEKSFEAASSHAEGELLSLKNSIRHLGPKEKTDYLLGYFQADIYAMFLSVLSLYTEQGGDILRLSSTLMEELTRIEETESALEKEARRNLIQYMTLWAMALAILGFLRFGLSSFSSFLDTSLTYKVSIALFFLFLWGSSLFYGIRYTGQAPFAKRKKTKGKP